MKTKNILIGAAFVAATSLSSISQAAPITVADVTASSTFSTYNVDNLINGSGLLPGGLYTGDTNNWSTKWMTNGTVTGSLTFDLGSVYDVSTSSIWNYGGGCCGVNRSVKDLMVEASLDNITYFSVGGFVLSLPVGIPFAGETISLNTTAQYIKFNLGSNYGDAFTGLSEVQFDGVLASAGPIPSVPEPSSIALIGLGLVGMGFRFARKRNAL